jgi:DNA repair protein RecO (recombination protein O)
VAVLRTEALVLRSADVGESDRILHLLVPAGGRLTAVAKGARRSRRRFAGTLDLFNHLRIEVERRGTRSLARLEHATLLEAFTPLRADSARFALGCTLIELLDRLAPEGAAGADGSRLFDFALGALRLVAARVPDARLRTLLELRALDALGLRPELGRCVRCGERVEGGRVDFLVAEGGPRCARCGAEPSAGGALRLHLGTLRALEQGLRLDLERLDRLAIPRDALREAGELVRRFQRFHLGIELRSEGFLDEALAARERGPRPPLRGASGARAAAAGPGHGGAHPV